MTWNVRKGRKWQSKVRCFTAVKAAKGICFRIHLEGNMDKWKRFKTHHPVLPRPFNLIFHEEEVNVDIMSMKYLQENLPNS